MIYYDLSKQEVRSNIKFEGKMNLQKQGVFLIEEPKTSKGNRDGDNLVHSR